MPRNWRLFVEPTAVNIEVGIGVRHRLEWTQCQAVLRFPDRLEFVLDPATSLVVRSSDWHRGEEALALADQFVPKSLLIPVDGEPEPGAAPYALDGLARHSAVVLATLAMSCLIIAVIGLGIGVSDRRGIAVLIGLGFCVPAVPCVRAIRRRLAVPRRWRVRAAQRSHTGVRLDHRLARMSERSLRLARIVLPVSGALAAYGWWIWTADVPVALVVVATGLAISADLELRRRRHRSGTSPAGQHRR